MRSPDAALRLLAHGYDFSDRLQAGLGPDDDPDAVPVRLMGRAALVVRGPDGVRLFTDTTAVRRRGAMPAPVAGILFGQGAVHGLDDEQHRHRKQLFVEATRADRVADLVQRVGEEWERQRSGWDHGPVTVYDDAVAVFGRAVLTWAGIDVPDTEAETEARRLAQVVDGFAVPGPAYLRAVRARRRSDQWAEGVVAAGRRGDPQPPAGSALALVSTWTGEAGLPLPLRTAAVELQNLLRPTVAVSRFASFAALALAQHASWRTALREEAGGAVPGPLALAFAQEVRRLAPFVPVLAGDLRREVTFHGRRLPAGTRLVLDVLGTNTDERHWPRALAFDPHRFLGAQHVEPDALVPQGGGEVAAGHRCPGEDIALGLVATTSATLASLDWYLPPQNLHVNRRRMPTQPASRLRLAVGS